MGDLTRRLTTRLLRGETILFLILVLALPASLAAQGAPHRAGLVIRFGDGSVITRCVSFNEASITGVELLGRAGLSIRVDTNSSIGAGVCKINNTGCDAGKSCFCQCEGSTCAYWQYFHLHAERSAWQYSVVGAGIYQVTDGAVEGWAWGNNVVPPVMTLDQICAAGLTSVPTSAPVVTTPRPTATIPASPTLISTATRERVTSTPSTQEVAPTASPTVIPTATPQPMAPPTSSSTSQPTIPPAQNTGIPSPVVSYAVFAILVVGLGAWLVIQARYRSRP